LGFAVKLDELEGSKLELKQMGTVLHSLSPSFDIAQLVEM
jgi:hypothetical protein